MPIKRYIKEPFPALSHLFGVGLSIFGLIFLINASGNKEKAFIVSFVYGMSLILLYLASTLTHGVHCSTKTALRFEQCDHAAIYLLIAGTYTPLCLFIVQGWLGWTMLAAEWLLAFLGIFQVFSRGNKSKLSQVGIYLAMGWFFLIALDPITTNIPSEYFSWLVGGALCYTIGSLFFIFNGPSILRGLCSSHDVWHVFVLSGSICHYVLIHHLIVTSI